jgi:hypothetical protein
MQRDKILVGLHENTSTFLKNSCFRKEIRGINREMVLKEFKL